LWAELLRAAGGRTPEQNLEEILKCSMLSARLVDEEEAARYESVIAHVPPEMTREQLVQVVISLREDNIRLSKRIEDLEAQAKGDRPPKRTADAPGVMAPPR